MTGTVKSWPWHFSYPQMITTFIYQWSHAVPFLAVCQTDGYMSDMVQYKLLLHISQVSAVAQHWLANAWMLCAASECSGIWAAEHCQMLAAAWHSLSSTHCSCMAAVKYSQVLTDPAKQLDDLTCCWSSNMHKTTRDYLLWHLQRRIWQNQNSCSALAWG